MISAVRRTGHSSYYVEKGMSAMGKTSKQLGLPGELPRIQGGGESQVTSWRCNRVTESGTTKRFLYGWRYVVSTCYYQTITITSRTRHVVLLLSRAAILALHKMITMLVPLPTLPLPRLHESTSLCRPRSVTI